MAMQISHEGLALLKELEGVRQTVYKDVIGCLTIGVGHLLTRSEISSGKIFLDGVAVRYGGGLAESQVETLLRHDTLSASSVLRGLDLAPELNQSQFDALTCFIFHVGVMAFAASTLRRRLDTGDYAAVPEQMRRWIHAGGTMVQGLQRRREREIALWLGEVT